MDTIGFVGASGLMGHGMAKNIVKAGYDLAYTVHRDTSRVADLDELGARRARSIADLGADCDVVVICVTTADDVEQVVSGHDGLLQRPRAGLIVVDATTSEPGMTRRLAARCGEHEVTLIDAPLTRGPHEAEAGTLNTLVGADDELLARLRPLFSSYSENIFHAGAVGAGHTIKLLNNFVAQSQANALAEAFAVAAKSDVDPQLLVDVLAAGLVNNSLLHWMGDTLHGTFDSMVFGLQNARKDVRYYSRLAGEVGVPAVVGDGVLESLTMVCRTEFGDEFVPSMVKAQAQLNNVEIKAGAPGRGTGGDGEGSATAS